MQKEEILNFKLIATFSEKKAWFKYISQISGAHRKTIYQRWCFVLKSYYQRFPKAWFKYISKISGANRKTIDQRWYFVVLKSYYHKDLIWL